MEGVDALSVGRQAPAESEAILAIRGRQAQPVRMSERPKERNKAKAQRRLAVALRDNLRRRKAQQRGRQEGRADAPQSAETDGKPHDYAGIGDEN